MRRLRILVVDDHPLFRQGLHWALAMHPDLELIGAAGDAAEALRLAETLLPDLVLCDINLPGERVLGALRAGAVGFLTKDAAGEELVAIIRRVANGEYPINDLVLHRSGVASRLLDQFRDLSEATEGDAEIFSPLSPRELGVLEAVVRGQSNKEIARLLSISDQTVKNHMTSILRKLAVNDRTQAVIQALRHGWLKLDPGDRPQEG